MKESDRLLQEKMKRARAKEESPDLARNLVDVPVDVIEKHIVPYLRVKEFIDLCRVDKRLAAMCEKMGDRVWKMFVRRDFPGLAAPSDLCVNKPLPNKCTYRLYDLYTFKLRDGTCAFFSETPDLVYDVWSRYRPGTDGVVWLLDPDRRITNVYTSNHERIHERMGETIQRYIQAGNLGLVGFVKPDNGAIYHSRAFYKKAEAEFQHMLQVQRKRKELTRLIEKRSRLDEEIAELDEELKRP